MGNFCCNEEVTKSKKGDEHHMEIEKSKPYSAIQGQQGHLETVKEDPYECSEPSEYRSKSRGSRY
jgi:hypothetical protein